MHAKNVRYTPGGGAEIVEVNVREPAAGEVQVEVAACGICSWDIQTFKAGSDSPYAAPPGHEGIGYVAKLGAGVTDVEIGQRVAGGGFGRLRNLPANRLYKIPDSNLDDTHWIVEPVSCVVTGMDHCRLRAGERLAMVGCGFMGLMMIQGLKGVGADQLIALDIDDRRLQLALEMGATEAHNVTAAGFTDVQADLRGRGIDVVVDTSGSQSGLDPRHRHRASRWPHQSVRLDQRHASDLQSEHLARQGHQFGELIASRATARSVPASHPLARQGHHRLAALGDPCGRYRRLPHVHAGRYERRGGRLHQGRGAPPRRVRLQTLTWRASVSR